MTKEQLVWSTAAMLINSQYPEPIVNDEDHEDDEIIQPIYEALMKFAEKYIELADKQK